MSITQRLLSGGSIQGLGQSRALITSPDRLAWPHVLQLAVDVLFMLSHVTLS